MEGEPVRASWGLVFVAVGVIGLSGVGIAVGLGGMSATWDICSVIGGLVLAGVGAAIGVQQFRAVFMRDAGAARFVGGMLFVVGGIVSLSVVMGLWEWVSDGALKIGKNGGFFLVLGVLAAGGLVGGWVNWQWSVRLTGARLSDASDIGPRGMARRDWLVALSMGAAIGIGGYFAVPPPECGAHLSQEEVPFSVPEDASDISYCQGQRGSRAYEFQTSEAAFERWIEDTIAMRASPPGEVTWEAITAPLVVRDYRWISPRQSERDRETVVREGLVYRWKHEDQVVRAVFDRATRRGYYWASFH